MPWKTFLNYLIFFFTKFFYLSHYLPVSNRKPITVVLRVAHTRRGRGATKGRRVPASSEKPESCHQIKQTKLMDGAVQPGGRGSLWTTIENSREEDRGAPS